MKSNVMVLSKQQLDERYSRLANTKMARLTKEAIEKGYSIALIEQEGLEKRIEYLSYDTQVALEQSVPKSSVIKIWCFTDMSELDVDKIYVAFKELKCHACAHSTDPDYCRISD